MVAKKKKYKKILLIVHYDDMNSEDFMVEVLSQTLGYDITQTMNCVSIIVSRGSYAVKSFDDINVASATLQLITDQGIPAELFF